VGTEGAAAAKDERAGASIGEAGEGVGVMGASEANAAGAASPPVKEAPEKSGTSETTGAAERGEISMAPIMTAVEFIFRPIEAIKIAHIKITISLNRT